jgi:hypothetical protein
VCHSVPVSNRPPVYGRQLYGWIERLREPALVRKSLHKAPTSIRQTRRTISRLAQEHSPNEPLSMPAERFLASYMFESRSKLDDLGIEFDSNATRINRQRFEAGLWLI